MSINCKAALRCKDCFYCVIYEDCARCHAWRPSKDGFPKVKLDAFCSCLTLPGTMERPYYVAPVTASAYPPPPPAQD